MPRPKRTKVAPSGPRAKKTVAPAPTPAVEPALTPPSFDDLYDVSDQEKANRSMDKGKGKGKVTAKIVAEDDDVRDSNTGHEEIAERRSASPELGLSDDMRISSSPQIETGRRGRRTPAMDSSVLAISKFRRRAREPSILGQRTARARSSSVESELAEENGLTSVGRTNNSMLGMGTSNRRDRQTSVQRGRAGSVRPSSAGYDMDRPTPRNPGSVLRVGAFKRRAREPSILGTAQKPQQARPDFDSDSDDFTPEDESTPLNFSKARGNFPSSASTKSRKRKLSTVQVPRSQETPRAQSSPSLLPLDDSEPEDTIPATGPLRSDDVESEAGEEKNPEMEEGSSQEDAPLPSIERLATPEPLSETMAPPRSSSSSLESLPSPPLPHPIRSTKQSARPRRIISHRTPPPHTHTQSSPISSPPSLTHSPDVPALSKSRRSARQPPQPAMLSTAALQALLPRRRQRQRSTLDNEQSDSEVDVTGLGEDDDELTITVRPTSRRQPSVAPKGTQPQRSKPTARKGKGKPRRTYGKPKPISDKENEPVRDPDDSLGPVDDEDADVEVARESLSENSSELEKRVGKELKTAAKKFKEVDKWELEFEECDPASSDRGAR